MREMTETSIELVRTEDQAEHVRAIAREFIEWLRTRYPDMLEGIEEYLKNQDFANMLEALFLHFTPPAGKYFLARQAGHLIGMLMLKLRAEDGVCEMKRMFVRESARGVGFALALVARLIERARELGYQVMVLSALDRHHEAIALYRSLGCKDDIRPNDTQSAAGHEVLMRLDF
jgi:GNAT superfamily N-acetyltransferase